MKTFINRLASLRFSLLFIVLLCWLVPTIWLGMFMGTRFFTALQEKTGAFLISGAQQAQVRTVENLSRVITLAKDAIYDGELTDAVEAYEGGLMSTETYFRATRSYLERKYGRESLCDFAIFFRSADPGSLFYTTGNYQEAMYFQEVVQPSVLERSLALDTGTSFFSRGGYTYLVRNLYNNRLEPYGMLLLGINTALLFDPILEWSAAWNASCCITLDQVQEGDLRYLDREDGLSEQGDLLLCTLTKLGRDYHTFRFQVMADKRAVYRERDSFRVLMTWMFVLLIPVCLLLMVFVNHRIVGPIRHLNRASKRIQNGELGFTLPIRGSDELGQLGRAFSAMSTQLKTLVDQSYKGQIALRDARIQAMQSRINPHFLNNALETINWQARMEDSETVSAMVEALSLLLNASMDRGEQHLVPLREEIRVADAYFYFIGLRFGDRLSVWKNIQEGLDGHLVPRLVIQTLLENAIEHGIEPAGGGTIRMNVLTRPKQLIIEVINNGKTLSEEDQVRIQRLLGDDSDEGGHMGIRNVARRLRLLYGEQAALTIALGARGETVATIALPVGDDKNENRLKKGSTQLTAFCGQLKKEAR